MEVTREFDEFTVRYAPGREFRFVFTHVRKCDSYVGLPIRYIEPFTNLGDWFLILSDQPRPDELGPIGEYSSPFREMLERVAKEETERYDRYLEGIAERQFRDYEPPCPEFEDD